MVQPVCEAQQPKGSTSDIPADTARRHIDSPAAGPSAEEFRNLIHADNFEPPVDPCIHLLRLIAFRNHELVQRREALESLLTLDGERDTEISEAREAIRQLEEQLVRSRTSAEECGPQ